MDNLCRVIAIDGPAGSGKSTVAKLLADKMQAIYIDTGAMYRAIGLYLKEEIGKIDESNEAINLLKNLNFEYIRDSNGVEIHIGNKKYTDEIRAHEVSEYASRASQFSYVRDFLLDKQRDLGNKALSVLEGRDIGSVVFPNAFCKIYLCADDEVRAKRRYLELKSRGVLEKELEEVIKDIKERDTRDREREHAPLVKVPDSNEVDTTKLSIDDVVDKIIDIAKEHASKKKINLKEG